jgi:hypothetical protein
VVENIIDLGVRNISRRSKDAKETLNNLLIGIKNSWVREEYSGRLQCIIQVGFEDLEICESYQDEVCRV